MNAILGVGRLNAFRLNYLPAHLRRQRDSKATIWLGGVLATGRVRRQRISIRDGLNDAPNTCGLVVEGAAPTPGQDLRVSVNSNDPHLLFNGTLQTVAETYEGRPTHLAWTCNATDDTSRANRYRPFGNWVDTSATVIAQQLTALFAPGLTTVHVQAGLPLASITFDGTETFGAALKRLANLVGGYCYIEDLDVHVFLTEATETPDAIDTTPGRFLDSPPISSAVDDSQLHTRVYGKGHGEAALVDVAAGDTIIPVASAVMFNPLGGKAIAGSTPDGAQYQRVTYTGIQAGGFGSLVGPGVNPAVAPTITPKAGAGIQAGVHAYGYTWVTAAGETPPSPLVPVTLGPIPAPSIAPVVAPVQATPVRTPGNYLYAISFVAGSGETLVSPSAAVTLRPLVPAPPLPGVGPGDGWGGVIGYCPPGTWIDIAYTYMGTNNGETLMGPYNSFQTRADNASPTISTPFNIYLAASPDPRVLSMRVYARNAYAGGGFKSIGDYQNQNITIQWNNPITYWDPPAAPTLGDGGVKVTLPIGSPGTTARNIYRTDVNASTLKFWYSVPDNTSTTITDSLTAPGQYGVPVANTTNLGQAAIAGVAVGPAGTTARKVYRTAANGAQLKLQQTIANNTATVGVDDATADASLGANAPSGDSSGLATVAGQVNAGSITLLTASAAGFTPTGGYVILQGAQTVRYSGITGNTLTGIPPSGTGAIVTTVPYGSAVIAAPALVGVTGIVQIILKGAKVCIWVRRDDTAAQSARAAIDAAQGRTSDGVVEHVITDDRRGEPSLIAQCDADLKLFGYPIVTVTYDTRDLKTRSGKPVTFNLPSLSIVGTLTIQDVTITEIELAVGVLPRFHVTASSTRFSLEDILRQLLTEASAT